MAARKPQALHCVWIPVALVTVTPSQGPAATALLWDDSGSWFLARLHAPLRSPLPMTATLGSLSVPPAASYQLLLAF